MPGPDAKVLHEASGMDWQPDDTMAILSGAGTMHPLNVRFKEHLPHLNLPFAGARDDHGKGMVGL